MKRHLSNLAFVVSLVAGALVLLLGVRSHWTADEVEWVSLRRGDKWAAWRETFIRSEAGGLRVDHRPGREAGAFGYSDNNIRPRLAWTIEAAATYPYVRSGGPPTTARMAGFAWGELRYDNAGSPDALYWHITLGEYFLVIPYWFLLLVASVLPAHRLVQTWRRRRRCGRGFDVSVV